MGSYKLNKAAKEDLWRIYSYGFERYGEARADKYLDDFYRHFELIAKNPYLYQSVDEVKPGYRRCVCGVDIIYYFLRGDIVEIMAILGQQDHRKRL